MTTSTSCSLLVALLGAGALAGCRDTSRFASRGDHFEGNVVQGSFVLANIGADTRLCLTLDTNRLQDTPGALTSSDGRFRATPLRSIPQIWHDPLSTLSFGEGRVQNLIYAATPVSEAQDVLVVVSLMDTGGIEVRMLRGAPPPVPDASAPSTTPIFGVFMLDRRDGTCSF